MHKRKYYYIYKVQGIREMNRQQDDNANIMLWFLEEVILVCRGCKTYTS
jgi:hypothetical protein